MEETSTGLEMTFTSEKATREALRVTFTNRGEEVERLLAQFEPTPVFFTVSVASEDGTPVHESGGGKVALNDPPSYVALAPGDSHAVDVDLGQHGWSLAALPPGRYTIGLAYHNQYGEGCFKGVLPSRDRLTLEVPA